MIGATKIDLPAETKAFFESMVGVRWKRTVRAFDGAVFYERRGGLLLPGEAAEQITKAVLKERCETALAVFRATFEMGEDKLPKRANIDIETVRGVYLDLLGHVKELEGL